MERPRAAPAGHEAGRSRRTSSRSSGRPPGRAVSWSVLAQLRPAARPGGLVERPGEAAPRPGRPGRSVRVSAPAELLRPPARVGRRCGAYRDQAPPRPSRPGGDITSGEMTAGRIAPRAQRPRGGRSGAGPGSGPRGNVPECQFGNIGLRRTARLVGLVARCTDRPCRGGLGWFPRVAPRSTTAAAWGTTGRRLRWFRVRPRLGALLSC